MFFVSRWAPDSNSVWARSAGHGRANAAKCNGVLPASSLAFGSAPTCNKALANFDDGN